MTDSTTAQLPTTPAEPTIEALGSITLIAARRWQPSAAAWAGLFVAAAVVAFWSLLPGPTLSDHECFVAQTSREMLDRNDWVVPYFSGMPRLQKSPLAYWTVAAISTVLGRFSDPVVRLPSAICAMALMATMALFARRAFGSAALAWFAAAVTAFSAVCLFYSHVAIADMQLTFWCTLAGALLWLGANTDTRPRRIAIFAGAGTATGMAMLAKMPMPLVVLLPGFLAYLVATGRTRKIGTYLLDSLPGIALMLLVWLPWIVLVLHRLDSQAVGDKWWREFISRYEGDIGGTTGPWYYYGLRLFGYLLPWTLSLPEALASPWMRRYRPWRDVLIFAFCMAIFNLVFFSSADFKRDHYLLPAMPWFLLLLTPPVWRFFAGPVYGHPRLFAWLGMTLAAASAVGCSAAWLLFHRADPHLAHKFLVPAAVFAAGLLAAGIVLATRARLEAFHAIILTITVTFCLSWNRSRLPEHMASLQREHSFAERVHQIVPPGAAFYNLGKPDPRLVYYGQLLIPRVLSDLETSKRVAEIKRQQPPRPDQPSRHGTQISQLVTLDALLELLRQPKPVYIVTSFGNWDLLQGVDQFRQLHPQLLYRHRGHEEEPIRDLVIFATATQERAAP